MTAPIVESVDVRAIRLPPSSPWEDATNRVQALEFIVVSMRCAGGITSTGYTYTVDIGGTSISALLTDYLVPLVLGRDVRNVKSIWAVLERQSRRLGRGVNRLAMAALDTALWDAVGIYYETPLSRLWGQHHSELSTYRSEISLTAKDTIEALRGRVAGYALSGYRDVKIKIGSPDPSHDIRRIAAARSVVGPGEVFVDVNQGWTLDQAKRRLTGLADVGVGWIEEPLAFDDIAGHAELRKHTPTPIALGESLFSQEQFLAYLRADAVDIVQADVAFVGGYTEWLRIAALADAFGKPVAPHYLMELSLPALCAAPNARYLEDVVGGSLSELRLSDSGVSRAGSMTQAPVAPGHGVQFRPEALVDHALSPERLRLSFQGGSK